MADVQVKNYYIINIIDSNENIIIPDSWIRARVGGAALVFLPPRDHDKLVQIGGPFCVSWSTKFAQIERGFGEPSYLCPSPWSLHGVHCTGSTVVQKDLNYHHFTEAYYHLNKTPALENNTTTLKIAETRNSERETSARLTENKHTSELEVLLRSDSHLLLLKNKRPRTLHDNKSLQETSLKSQPEMSLKEGNTLEALLRKPQAPPVMSSKPLLSKDPMKTSESADRNVTKVVTLNYGQVIESTVSAQLRPSSDYKPENKKNIPGLLPIKTLKHSKVREAVQPVQIARVAPLAALTSVEASVIVLNKTAYTKDKAGLKDNSNIAPSLKTSEEKNEAAPQEEHRKEAQDKASLEDNSNIAPSLKTSEEKFKAAPQEEHRKEAQDKAGLKDNSNIAPPLKTSEEKNEAAPQEEHRKEAQNDVSTDIDKTNSLYGASSNAYECLDWAESVEAAKEYLMKMHSSLNQNCEHKTLNRIPVKSNLPLFKTKLMPTKEQSNIAGLEQLHDTSLKHNDENRRQETNNSNNLAGHNKNIDKLSRLLVSTSPETSSVTPIRCTPLMLNYDNYSRSKRNLLTLTLKSLRGNFSIFQNIKMTRDNLSRQVKVTLETTKKTRKLISTCLKTPTTSSKRKVFKVVKPSPNINAAYSQEEFVKSRPYSMDVEEKWTLKYKKQKRDTVELMPNSHIYVSKNGLVKCIKYARDYKHLGRLLLNEVFTEHALNRCSMTRGRAPARPGSYRRPGLNQAGLKALCDFVEMYKPNLKHCRLYINLGPVDRKELRKSISNYIFNRRK